MKLSIDADWLRRKTEDDECCLAGPLMMCKLCDGTGENRTEVTMLVNNHICPRCGSYGTLPNDKYNTSHVNEQDWIYINANGVESNERQLDLFLGSPKSNSPEFPPKAGSGAKIVVGEMAYDEEYT